MKDCDKDIRGYHADRVALTEKQRADLRERRDANRRRVEKGLEANDDPVPEEFVIQGSYAMRTTIQEPGNDYDIDDGAVFSEESLEGARGGRHVCSRRTQDGARSRRRRFVQAGT